MPEITEAQPNTANDQLLHLVLGGELAALDGTRFKDTSKLDVVGIFPNYATAKAAWKGAAQRTVPRPGMVSQSAPVSVP